MADDKNKNNDTATPEGEDGTKPGGERQADTLTGTLPEEDQKRPETNPVTKAGEYMDISVDTDVNPKDKKAPRPTAAGAGL